MFKKGFTLLELMVVLVIISLMSVIVAPRFVGTLTHMNLKTAAKKIAASLRYARSQAASEKKTYVSVFDFDKNHLVIIVRKEDSDRTSENYSYDEDENNTNRTKIYKLPDGIKFENAVSVKNDINSGQFEIVFYPAGNSSGGEITIADEREKQYKINVDFITGTVEVRSEK